MGDIKLETSVCIEHALLLSFLSRRNVHFASRLDATMIPEFVRILSPASKLNKVEDGTVFIPGPLVSGKLKDTVKSIPESLSHIIVLSPFLGDELNLELTGLTNHGCHSTDLYKITYQKMFRAFKLPKFDLNVKKRGFGPLGGGIATYNMKPVRKVQSIKLSTEEKINKIRGLVITARIGSNTAKRIISKIKSEMSELANTKVLCIVNNRNESGPSPGFECSVIGESDNGVIYVTVSTGETPERVAEFSCCWFLETLDAYGIFDEKILHHVVILMGLADGVSHLVIGNLDGVTKYVLELLKIFFNVSYKVEISNEKQILTVIGCNYSNRHKPL